MSYLNVEQKIAKSFADVSTRIRELIDDNGIETDEVKFLKIAPFGAGQFVCLIVYAMLREIRIIRSPIGLSVTRLKKIFKKAPTKVTMGLIVSLAHKLKDIEGFAPLMALLAAEIVLERYISPHRGKTSFIGAICAGTSQKIPLAPPNTPEHQAIG